jgi:DNA primase large subunit
LADQTDLKNFDTLVAELLKIRNELLEATRRIEPQTPAKEGAQGEQPRTLPPMTPTIQLAEKQKETGVKVSLLLLAKYPFLSAAHPLLRAYYPKNTPREVYDRALERILEAIEHGERGVLPRLELPWVELLSFNLARHFVMYVDDSWLRRRWALAEAARVEHLLNKESDEVLTYIINDLGLNIKKETGGGNWLMYTSQYLRLSRRLRPMPGSQLINRRINSGRVMLARGEVIKLIKEWLYDSFSQTRATSVNWDAEEIESIREALQSRFARIVVSSPSKEWPPCMVSLRNRVAETDNYGQFALIVYMANKGYSLDEIVNVLRLRSDFDEEVAKRQAEYISAQASSQTKNESPSCFAMKMCGLCIDNGKWCPGDIKNPLQYPSPQTVSK